jgi:putative sigma-54 modulation protein
MAKRRATGDVVIHIKGRNIEVTDPIRKWVAKKMGHLNRYFDQLAEIDVILTSEHVHHPEQRIVAEANAHVQGRLLHAKGTGADPHTAIDTLVDTLHQQLTRYKERLQTHRALGLSEATALEEATQAEVGDTTLESEQQETKSSSTRGGRIVREQQILAKPMFPDEAVEELESLGQPFLIFLNAENDQINVLYRRHDNTYGLIEPVFE